MDYTDNSRTFSGVSTGELWVSWLYSVNNATAASSYSGLTLNPNAAEELYFGDQFGSGQFVAADSAGETTLFSLTSGQVYFLIAQIQFNTSGSADTIKLYLNGNTANPIYTKSTINVGTLNAIGFGASVNSSSFDEIRVGTALGDIALVPEPGAITWIAAGLAVVGVGRRCRVNHLM